MKIDFRSDTSEVWALYPGFTGKLAFDIGANGGAVTRILAKNFEHVVAIEPAHESYEDLFHDCPKNVWPMMTAVSDRDGSCLLQEADIALGLGELVTITDDSPLARGWGAPIAARAVSCVSLDTLVDMYGEPDFIKIDVEGHEGKVIDGGRRALQQCSPILLIEIHSGALGEYIQEALPDYEWVRYNHEQYVAKGSALVNQHYWLRGEK